MYIYSIRIQVYAFLDKFILSYIALLENLMTSNENWIAYGL